MQLSKLKVEFCLLQSAYAVGEYLPVGQLILLALKRVTLFVTTPTPDPVA